MTIWTTEQDNYSTIGKQKDVIVVESKDDLKLLFWLKDKQYI